MGAIRNPARICSLGNYPAIGHRDFAFAECGVYKTLLSEGLNYVGNNFWYAHGRDYCSPYLE
jgi:hypothetical protein